MGWLRQNKRGHFPALARITVRLRIALMVIVVLTAAAGISAVTQARSLLGNYTAYQSTAQPMLKLAQRVREDVSDMTLSLTHMTALSQDSDLVNLTRLLKVQRDRVRRDLSELAALGGAPGMLATLDQQLETGHQSVLAAIAEHSKFVQSEERLDAIIGDILALQDRGHAVLEDMVFLITSESDRLVRRGPEPGSDPSLINDRLATLFQETLNLNEIGYSLDSVVNAAMTMRELDGNDTSLRPTFLAQEELRSIIATLAQFQASSDRRVLADILGEIRRLITTKNGFFDLQRRQYALRQEAAAVRTAYVPILEETARLADQLVAEMISTAESAAEALQGTLEKLVWMLTAAFCLAVVAVLITNHLIIERQFSRRIARLTESTRAIAAGNLAQPVDVEGADELGEMAEALRIFRGNAEDLKRSNVELEKFAYVAAHDLRSPLRAVSDLAAWIEEDTDNTLSSESGTYLGLMQDRIRRLDRLLRDLLAYARAGTAVPEKEWVVPEDLVREQFRLSDPDGQMRLIYDGPEIQVLVEPTALQQILANLFVNARRHHDQPEGAITVRTSAEAGTLVLDIRDDGPGIPLKYQEKVFELFQTLRPRDDVEGSGLGLAIIRKLLDRQDGQIELISDPDKQRGTLFRITLPLPEPARPAAVSADRAA